MIGFAAQDSHGAVNLLNKKQAHHLVRKGHAREAHLLGCQRVDGWCKSVGAAYDEHHSARHGVLALLQIIGKLHAAKFLASLVQQYDMVAIAQGFADEFSLALFLLLVCEGFRILEFGNHLQAEGDVVAHAVGVFRHKGVNTLVRGFADKDKMNFHVPQIFLVGKKEKDAVQTGCEAVRPLCASTQEERGIPPSVHRYTLLYIGVGARYSSLLSFVICNYS